MNRSFLRAAAILLLAGSAASGAGIDVADDAGLQAALRRAEPGDVVRIAAGRYRPGVYVSRLRGTAESPIVIEGADNERPPRFEGGQAGWHLQGCSWIVLRNIEIEGASGNGLNVDDGGDESSHITLERIVVREIGPTGNRDGIKLSGLRDFTVRDCRVEGWGGEGVDMVGCHDGLIEGCTLLGREGFSQTCGVQAKGGSSGITIRRCRFENVNHRSVNIGGSTGREFFRPRDATWEAKDITVEGCTFIGSDAPISFVGVDGAVVRFNTIVSPRRWIVRILQETTAPEFVRSRNGRFERNLILYEAGQVRTVVNVGGQTEPSSFVFRENWWYATDRPRSSRPELPTAEANGVYGVDPQWRDAGMQGEIGNRRAGGYGAGALPAAVAEPRSGT